MPTRSFPVTAATRAVQALPLAALLHASSLAAQSGEPEVPDAPSAPPAPMVLPVIDACFVPVSGTIYRLNTTASPAVGAPANCTSPTHVRFQITQGAAIGPDLIFGGRLRMSRSGSFGGSIFGFRDATPSALLPAGAGRRFMYVADLGAVRAGYVEGDRWDLGRIGWHSVALGFNTEASAWRTFAMGEHAQATTRGATAFGTNTRASGEWSFVGGDQSVASGRAALAFELQSTASGERAVALGAGARATDREAIALGLGPEATALHSIAIGRGAKASAQSAMALGTHAEARHGGALVISDGGWSPSRAFATSVRADEIALRAAGGIRLRVRDDMSQGCDIDTNGRLSCTGGIDVPTQPPAQPFVPEFQRTASAWVSTTGTSIGGHNETIETQAGCPTSDWVATGGGVETDGGDAKVRETHPFTTGAGVHGWRAAVRNDSPGDQMSIRVFVVCMRVR